MGESDPGLQPWWDGRKGAFEIWFLVVFAPAGGRAWWLRYTTFAPAASVPGAARATLWGAAFAAGRPSVALKTIAPHPLVADGGLGAPWARIGGASLSDTRATGGIERGGHSLSWDLRVEPACRAAAAVPRLLERIPAPTRAAPASPEIICTGWVELDGRRTWLERAWGVRRHLWGTRRVEELVWLACPRFPDDPTVRLEATAVRPRAGYPPRLVPMRFHARGVDQPGTRLRDMLVRNRVEVLAPSRLRFVHASATHRLVAEGRCDPCTLVGYVYRDPAGWDVYVAQSDVASCSVEMTTRPRRRAAWEPAGRWSVEHAAAIEFHGLAPLPGVSYLEWDAEEPRKV